MQTITNKTKDAVEQHVSSFLNQKSLDLMQRFNAGLFRTAGERPLTIGGLALQYYGVEDLVLKPQALISKMAFEFTGLKNTYSPNDPIDLQIENHHGLPHPDEIRHKDTLYPTVEGLVWVLMSIDKTNNQKKLVSLLKKQRLNDENLKEKILEKLPQKHTQKFMELWSKSKNKN